VDHPRIATARDLVDQCDYFLAALAAHWQVIAAHLPDGYSDKCNEMPFGPGGHWPPSWILL
jgi:hypothetical protein